MNRNAPFQYIILTLFGVIIVIAVLVFAGFGGSGRGAQQAKGAILSVWGTVPESVMGPVLSAFNADHQDTVGRLDYFQKSSVSLEQDLVNALASGKGPDLVLMPHSLLARQSDKLLPLSYEQFSQRKYLDTYADGADIFLTSDGILALPLVVDPVVLYWNKQLLSGVGIAKAPTYWDEVQALPEKLVVKDQRGTISQAAVALGGYRNIAHAKEILSSLFLQVGDPITQPVFQEGAVRAEPVLGKRAGEGIDATESALRFYVQFADPAKNAYSWNSALPRSRDLFTTGTLALYPGTASDLLDIQSLNPHLSFDVASLPQVRPAGGGTRTSRVYGSYIGAAALRSSKNPALAVQAAYLLSASDYGKRIADAIGLPSARRDLLSLDSGANAFTTVFKQAALNAHAWLDPSPAETDTIFRSMVESLLTGGITERQALSAARADMTALSQ